MADGIWYKKPVKFAVMLWRLKWGLISSFMVLRQSGRGASLHQTIVYSAGMSWNLLATSSSTSTTLGGSDRGPPKPVVMYHGRNQTSVFLLLGVEISELVTYWKSCKSSRRILTVGGFYKNFLGPIHVTYGRKGKRGGG